jgi:hypothetical protein
MYIAMPTKTYIMLLSRVDWFGCLPFYTHSQILMHPHGGWLVWLAWLSVF